ncbi:MAG: 3-hydroxyacyl-CoA dehydrogenase family protein [Bacteroidota bacterium]|nr:3-hydroxyacyl-CoA dehydrogenase family protein [Candidatus Kapabacteria bacterium]MDW8218987.1 3-hydroxyacyl-CoA dehydrogenase family protein [Bacteroidota bacterium]
MDNHAAISQPCVLLISEQHDQRSIHAFAALLHKCSIQFQIILNGAPDTHLASFAEKIVANTSELSFRPDIIVDFSLYPDQVHHAILTFLCNQNPTALFVFSTPTLTAAYLAKVINAPNTIRANLLAGFFPEMTVIELAYSRTLSAEALLLAETLFRSVGLRTETIDDIVGFVVPRIVAMLVNEAAFAVLENISTPSEIDTAMKLGTNYPYGPLEWAENIGFDVIFAILEALYAEYNSNRYSPCRLLHHYAVERLMNKHA